MPKRPLGSALPPERVAITSADIEAAAEQWQQDAPAAVRSLLDAEGPRERERRARKETS